MSLRTGLVMGGLVAAALVTFVGCGSSATTAPATPTAAAATPAPAASVAAPSTATGAGASAAAGAAQGGSQDAASLVTADMAASVIGGSPTAVTLPGNIVSGVASLASYANANGDDVTVVVEHIPSTVPAAMLQAAIQMAGAKGDLQAVSGLGDAAGKVVGTNDATIAFAKGGTIVVLGASASGMTGSDLESKLESLAQQVAGKV